MNMKAFSDEEGDRSGVDKPDDAVKAFRKRVDLRREVEVVDYADAADDSDLFFRDLR